MVIIVNSVNHITEKEREHPHCHLIQFLCLVAFFFVWILETFVITSSVCVFPPIPLPIRLFIFSFLICLSFAISRSLHNLVLADNTKNEKNGHKHHPPDQIIDFGVMAYVRHPLYLAMLLFYLAFVILTMSTISFLIWIIIVFIHNKMASFEENQLLKMFNDQYSKYQKTVPKWLPNPIRLIRR